MKQLQKSFLISLCFIGILLLIQSQTYAESIYWVGDGTTNNWNDANNWSNYSKGNGTLTTTLPSDTSDVFFDGGDANSKRNCIINSSITLNSIKIYAAYVGIIDINGNTFNIIGANDNYFYGGTINDGLGSSSVFVNSTGITSCAGTVFGANVSITSSRLYLSGSTFGGIALLNKSGTTDDWGVGGNTFNGITELINSGSSVFATGTTSADIFNADLTLTNTGSSELIIATGSTGNQVNANLIVDNSSNLSNSSIILASTSASKLTITGTTTVTNSGSGASQTTYLGSHGDVTFEGLLFLKNIGTGSGSIILLNTNANSSNLYNGDIQFECTNSNSTGIKFSQDGGSGTLSAGNTMSIGALGFSTAFLWFKNFIQIGTTSQNFTLTGDADLALGTGLIFNGNVNFTAPKFRLSGGIYNGTTTIFHKTGSTYDWCGGGTTYNTNLEIKNSGTGTFDIANTSADDYNGDVTYTKTSTGSVLGTNNKASTFAGNINFNSNTAITIASNTNGRVILDGTGIQTINNTGSTPSITFRRLTINKTGGKVILNTPITAETDLNFSQGYIVSTAVNIFTIRDNITITGASYSSFVSGPVKKIGNDAFTFPIGDINTNTYAPLTISAPSWDEFTATYFNTSPNSLYSVSSKEVSLDHLSECEYWTLDRTAGSSSVNVSLSFDSPRSCIIDNLSDLRIARWNGTEWKDHGNGGTSGTTASGTLITSAAVSSFSPFTLASSTANNAFPITLLNFSAILNNNKVDLKWSTSSEINNDFFTVERCSDFANWETILTHKGAGNSNEIINYFDLDNNPLNRLTYYRLKQTDFDGKYNYSDIVSVQNIEEQQINIFPNPTNGSFNLSINGVERQNSLIEIYSPLGKMVYSKTIRHQDGVFTTDIDLPNKLSSGIYLIYVNIGDELFREKLIIK